MTKLLKNFGWLLLGFMSLFLLQGCSEDDDWVVYDSLRETPWIIEHIDNNRDSPFRIHDVLYFYSNGVMDVRDFNGQPVARGTWSNDKNILHLHIQSTHIDVWTQKQGPRLLFNCNEPMSGFSYVMYLTDARAFGFYY